MRGMKKVNNEIKYHWTVQISMRNAEKRINR